MNYICTKKLSLGGTDYRPGDVIPDGAFTGDRAKKLKAFGYITDAVKTVDSPPASGVLMEERSAETLSVTFDAGADGAKTAYQVNAEQLQAVIDLTQKTADAAGEAIREEVDETVLALIARIDSRKTVKETAEKQLGVIASLRDGPDTSTESEGTTEKSEQ